VCIKSILTKIFSILQTTKGVKTISFEIRVPRKTGKQKADHMVTMAMRISECGMRNGKPEQQKAEKPITTILEQPKILSSRSSLRKPH
jgi:hypothetical protein